MTALVVFAGSFSLRAQQGMAIPPTHTPAYEQMKQAGKFQQGLNVINSKGETTPLRTLVQPAAPAAPANCQCMITVDNTFSVVPFSFGTAPDYRNDDFSSPLINLPFNFSFYGVNQTNCYINNNGNISFGTPYGTFSATGFPTNQVVMIAPFWADVDTRNLASGLVYYKITPGYMIVRWQTVGYYSQHTDKLNDFQLIISDGVDPILPAGSNVSFCYGDMQWTTGDASLGTNGFGGTPATVGVNRGDGINYLQIGTFDQAGLAYDGPYGLNDGISWLDNLEFFFNVSNTGSGNNMPPIMQAPQVCDTFVLCVGDTFPFSANFLSPEPGQITTANIVAPGVTGINIVSSTSGNPATIFAELVGMTSNIGYNTITVSGTDNGSPAQTTSGVIVIQVIPGPVAQFSTTPVCPGDPMVFTDNSLAQPGNGPITTWGWDFGDPPSGANNFSVLQNPSHTYNTSGSYSVILTVEDSIGCKTKDTAQVTVYPLPVVSFTSDINSGCSPLCVNFTDLSTVAGSTINAWSWDFGNGNTDNTQNPSNICYLQQGDYTVTLTVTSVEGCSSTDLIVDMIHVIPGPQADFILGPQPVTITNPLIYFTDKSFPVPSSWTWDFGDPLDLVNNTSTLQDPSHMYGDTGAYCARLIVTGDNGTCPDTMIKCLEISPDILTWIPNSFTPNNTGVNDVFLPVFSDASVVKDFEMLIFDRWGNLVFKTNDPSLGWDGKVQGSSIKVQLDTYVYKIMVTDKYIGKEYRYIGHVNVIR
ncbi:MAG: hypothetical protein FD123_4051 [Bacteroidetes bacterium]|nr:MAG: hypothetical protein FD123_4051 [Bacteroidota bacterium]